MKCSKTKVILKVGTGQIEKLSRLFKFTKKLLEVPNSLNQQQRIPKFSFFINFTTLLTEHFR